MYLVKQIGLINKINMKQLFSSRNLTIKISQSQSIQPKSASDQFMKLEIRGECLKFPYVWLRDNCQCVECFHQSAKSRILNWSNFDLEVKPTDVVSDENSVEITWNDGHKSLFKLDWLKFRSFTPQNRRYYNETIFKPKKNTWKGDQFEEICSKHNYNEILNSNEALYNWLHKLSIYGVTLIKDTPGYKEAINNIIERVGFMKTTHYGVKYTVQHIPNTSNVAYLSSNLQMHTDLPYYEYGPGVTVLHCLVQTESNGGENLLSDCHYVANHMKENYPKEYKLLTETEVEWSDVGVEHGNEFFKLHRTPVICLNKHGEISRVSFSIPQRGSHFLGDIEIVKPWYEAHSLFLTLNHKFSAKFKTRTGDILVFDNTRMLHGRNAYNDSSNNVRKIIGAYIDWDEIYSRLRCLKVKLKNIDGI